MTDPTIVQLPDLDTIPTWAWASRLVYSWFRHLHNQVEYVKLGLTEYRYINGGLLPVTMEGDGSLRVQGEALPFHAVIVDDSDTQDSYRGSSGDSGEGVARDVVDLIGAIAIKAKTDDPSSMEIERIAHVLEWAALEPEKRRELQELSRGDTNFRILGGPQARREGSAGRPTQWAWGYRLRLTGPFRQITPTA